MSDQGFREVQLSGKQVVFLFMALAVVLVGTFLLGVSVGRHVEPEAASAQATPTATSTAADVNASKPMPPATTPVPGDLRYKETLRGQSDPVNPVPATTPAQTPAETPTPKAEPVPATKPPAPAAAGEWWVQTDPFSPNVNASKEVSELKAKTIAAKIIKSGSHFQVRVGPFDRQAAEAMDARLRKLGYNPRVTR